MKYTTTIYAVAGIFQITAASVIPEALSTQNTQISTAWFTDGMSGADNINGMFQGLTSFMQNVGLDMSNLNSDALKQISIFEQMLNSEVASVSSVLQTNSFVNGILLPFTNFSEFLSDAHGAVSNFETQLNSEVNHLEEQASKLASAVRGDVTIAATDFGNILNLLQSFSQKVINMTLATPPLTATTLMNSLMSSLIKLFGADPVKTGTNYSAWESEVSSRQSVLIGNYNSVYTYVSTRLPQAESAVIALLSQYAKFWDAVTNGKIQSMSQAQREDAYSHISSAVSSDASQLVTLNNDESIQNALQSVVYYHQSSHGLGTVTESIQYMALPTFEYESATATHTEPLHATLTS
ncbi:hypothetical protein COEREDRAFT_7642 [Coemansia reversa NRRL 1564]|uniref:Uncharacterized protein n=1 Tax=Coemansia reversa (strain ATCC 12441 / NRRL 1564) TaxID=763665 RepID=A0A2G5BE47_COERN|nr:hypothetical protein COEREDRAFT_7642 [Coemansia reversa NRRL 1564]|eukprot:PIA17288.1 hypothetical protein COEREDRAFT_7642 [Coemansia reversa NRRL 1564]